VLPTITIPPSLGTPENVSTVIVDSSAQPQDRAALNKELRRSNVILLVYSAPDHYSYERIGLFWIPHFRSLGVNVPIVLCATKSDLLVGGGDGGDFGPAPAVEDEMLPLMAEFREIDSCVRTSSREHRNVNEAFFLCQKAVTHPIAPLYSSQEAALRPAAVSALRRIFWLNDADQDGFLSDRELLAFQDKCFAKSLGEGDLSNIKATIARAAPTAVSDRGIDADGFLALNTLFAQKGRHETIWLILRAHQYTDSLSLRSSFLYPPFTVPANSSAELGPLGYQFLFDLFLLFDHDSSGALTPASLEKLFAPTTGLPPSWIETNFPTSCVRNEHGDVTLQGWLAQWSMSTFVDPRTTLAYLGYLGFTPPDPSRQTSAAALKTTKPRKRAKSGNYRANQKVERTVLHAYVLGSSGSGKSSLLDALLGRPFNSTYHPSLTSRTAVNSVELPGGKQVYLILEELGPAHLETAVLGNRSRVLEAAGADLLLYCYDSNDPESFGHVKALRERAALKYLKDEGAPAIFVALKADLERVMQRSGAHAGANVLAGARDDAGVHGGQQHGMGDGGSEERPGGDDESPEAYCAREGLNRPTFASVRWEQGAQELFVGIAEACLHPSSAYLKREEDVEGAMAAQDRLGLYAGLGAVVAVGAAGVVLWRRMHA